MTFKNKKHAERFFTAIHDNHIKSTNKQMLAALYLLTFRKKVWNSLNDSVIDDGNDIDLFILSNYEASNLTDQILVDTVMDIMCSTVNISICDLLDDGTVPDDAFWAIVFALLYYRTSFEECPVRDLSEIDFGTI